MAIQLKKKNSNCIPEQAIFLCFGLNEYFKTKVRFDNEFKIHKRQVNHCQTHQIVNICWPAYQIDNIE